MKPRIKLWCVIASIARRTPTSAPAYVYSYTWKCPNCDKVGTELLGDWHVLIATAHEHAAMHTQEPTC